MAKGSEERTPVIVVASSSSASASAGESPTEDKETDQQRKIAKKQVKKAVSFDPVVRKKFVPHRDDDCGIDECHCTGGAPCHSRWYTKRDLASVKAEVVETVTAAKTVREKRRRRRKLHRFDTELHESDSDKDDVDDGQRCLRGIEHLVDVGGPGHVPGSGVHAPGAARKHASAVLNEQFKQRRNKMLCGGNAINESEWAAVFWSALARVSEGRTKEARDKAIKRGERDAAAAKKIRSEDTAHHVMADTTGHKDRGSRSLPFLWSRRAAASSVYARIQIDCAMAAGDGGGDGGTSTAKGGGIFHKDKAKKKKKGHRFELELEPFDLALDFTS